MPATSEKQRKAMGVALAAKRGKIPESKLKSPAKELVRSMSASQLMDFAKKSGIMNTLANEYTTGQMNETYANRPMNQGIANAGWMSSRMAQDAHASRYPGSTVMDPAKGMPSGTALRAQRQATPNVQATPAPTAVKPSIPQPMTPQKPAMPQMPGGMKKAQAIGPSTNMTLGTPDIKTPANVVGNTSVAKPMSTTLPAGGMSNTPVTSAVSNAAAPSPTLANQATKLAAVKQSDETAALEPMDTETSAKAMKEKREYEGKTPVYKDTGGPTANAPDAIVHVPDNSSDKDYPEVKGSVINGNSAFVPKEAEYNPLVYFMMPNTVKQAFEFNQGGLASKEPEKARKVISEEPKQLEMGIDVEKEHSPELPKRKATSADHLVEDEKYYTHLKAMEKAVKEDKDVSSEVKKVAAYLMSKISTVAGAPMPNAKQPAAQQPSAMPQRAAYEKNPTEAAFTDYASANRANLSGQPQPPAAMPAEVAKMEANRTSGQPQPTPAAPQVAQSLSAQRDEMMKNVPAGKRWTGIFHGGQPVWANADKTYDHGVSAADWRKNLVTQAPGNQQPMLAHQQAQPNPAAVERQPNYRPTSGKVYTPGISNQGNAYPTPAWGRQGLAGPSNIQQIGAPNRRVRQIGQAPTNVRQIEEDPIKSGSAVSVPSSPAENISQLKPADVEAIKGFVQSNPNMDDMAFNQLVESRGLDPEEAMKVVHQHMGSQISKAADVQQAFARGVLYAVKSASLTHRGIDALSNVLRHMYPEFSNGIGIFAKQALVEDSAGGRPKSSIMGNPQVSEAVQGMQDTSTPAQRFMKNKAMRELKTHKGSKKGVIPHPQDVFGGLGNRLAIKTVADRLGTSTQSDPVPVQGQISG